MTAFGVLIASILSTAALCYAHNAQQQINDERAVQKWIQQLQSPLAAKHVEAQRALLKHGDTAIALLAEELKSTKENRRWFAALALAEFGPKGKAAVPALMVFVDLDGNISRRLKAADALGKIGADALPAVPLLLKRLPDDRGTFLGAHMAPALQRIGPKAAPLLLKALAKQPNPHTGWLVTILVSYDRKYTLSLLRHPSAFVRKAAVSSIDTRKENLPPLIAMLDDADVEVRAAAAYQLKLFGRLAAPAVNKLRKLLQEKHDGIRGNAAWTVAKIGPAAKAAHPELIAALKLDSTRLPVSYALMKIGSTDEAVRGFIQLLDANVPVHHYSRYNAAIHLGEIGPPAQAAVPRLIAALDDKSFNLRSCSATALAAIGPAARGAIIPCAKLIGDREQSVQVAAAKAIVQLQPRSKKEIAAVLQAGENWNFLQEDVTIYSLEKLSLPMDKARPLLIDAMRNSKNVRLRIFAAHVLFKNGEKMLATPFFRTALAATTAREKLEAVQSLRRLRANVPSLNNDIERLLKDQN